MSFAEDLSAAGYLLAWKTIRRLPERWVLPVAYRCADWLCRQGTGMDQLRRNLSRVVGPENVTRDLVKQSMRSYARYWVEAFRLPEIHARPELISRLYHNLYGLEYLDHALDSGRGVILVLPHSGNWDMAGVFLVNHWGRFTTVAERLKPEVLFQAFVDYREQLGFEVKPLHGGAPPFPELREKLISGGVVCLLGERDIRHRGVPVRFFGEDTTMPAGPVKLAQETGASLHVVHLWYPGEGEWALQCSPEIPVTDLAETMQKVANEMARNIQAHPQDWHVLQPLWPQDRARVQEKRRKKRRG
ncbi:phosphatidylinositol mannoside acyltransferase [Corynebacterium poyangense]|uniref:Phosphatidylinositol mannoside acyltransferase n=1 Tax=Corynebacterium poyangense TaxID=2684405 RepID=A0A7H0SP62_9CORY|nr:phosphatidylinositol mannoside acyltransferase [Corynebacterium poyangense]QNQ90337.1 phosphatidylinositol mannoside acyltransferase [Corynebacterium poyangense]